MRRALLLTVALASGGCGLIFDPCGDLEDRLCSDLGPDCEVFRSHPSIHESVIPRRRRQAERAQCEMLVADANYASYTLPWVRYQIAVTREPSTPAPQLPQPRAVDGLASGFGSWFLCCVPFVVIPFILFVGWRSRQQIAAAQAQGAPTAGSPAPAGGGWGATPAGWAHVTSAQAAQAQVASGALVQLELLPAATGGQPVPENTVYLPPAAASRKRELDGQAIAMTQRGEATGYAAEPEYRGASFVPARLRVVLRTPAGEQTETIDVW